MKETTLKAIEKLDSELTTFKGNRKAIAMAPYVAETLKMMAENEAVANAIIESAKTISDCLEEITKGTGNYISDMHVYGKAAKFYFPDAKVDIVMRINADGIETTQEGVKDEAIKPIKPVEVKKEALKKKAEGQSKPEKQNKPLEVPVKEEPVKDQKKNAVIQLSLFD